MKDSVEDLSVDFDFDRWATLAKASPQEFAMERDRLIRGLIKCSSSQEELVTAQLTIDSDRYAHGPGLRASCHALLMAFELVELLVSAVHQLELIAESHSRRIRPTNLSSTTEFVLERNDT